MLLGSKGRDPENPFYKQCLSKITLLPGSGLTSCSRVSTSLSGMLTFRHPPFWEITALTDTKTGYVSSQQKQQQSAWLPRGDPANHSTTQPQGGQAYPKPSDSSLISSSSL